MKERILYHICNANISYGASRISYRVSDISLSLAPSPSVCYNTHKAVSQMKEKRNKGDIFISLWIIFGVIVILGFFVFSMIIGGSAGLGYQCAAPICTDSTKKTPVAGKIKF